MIQKLSVILITVAMLAPLSAFQEPYKAGGLVTAPKVTSRVEPAYTQDAKAAKIEGSVLLKLVVDHDGLPKDIEVAKSLDPGLDLNAILAVSQWRFDPGMKDGEAVDVLANIEIHFRLL